MCSKLILARPCVCCICVFCIALNMPRCSFSGICCAARITLYLCLNRLWSSYLVRTANYGAVPLRRTSPGALVGGCLLRAFDSHRLLHSVTTSKELYAHLVLSYGHSSFSNLIPGACWSRQDIFSFFGPFLLSVRSRTCRYFLCVLLVLIFLYVLKLLGLFLAQ